MTRPQQGLFPTPKEIELDCSCPDWADLCKHVAAALYGVGARLDLRPELLFLLRGVDPADLISQASAAETVRQSAHAEGAATMTETEMADVFGIELADTPPPAPPKGKSRKPIDPAPATPISKPFQKAAAKVPKKAGATASSAARARKPSARKLSLDAQLKVELAKAKAATAKRVRAAWKKKRDAAGK